MQALPACFPRQRHEDEEQYIRRIDIIKSEIPHFVTPSDPTFFFTRFYQRNQVHTVNQVCTSEIVKSQGENSDVQRIIRTLTRQEIPTNQVNFASTFFEKLFKNCKKFAVVNNVLYRQFFDNVGNSLPTNCSSSRNYGSHNQNDACRRHAGTPWSFK